MRAITVLTLLAVLALACNLGVPSAVQQIAEEVAQQAATQIPAAIEPTSPAMPTAPPEETQPEQPEETQREESLCLELGLPLGVPLPGPGFAGWTGGQLPAGLTSDLDAWARPFLQQAVGEVTTCGWSLYSGPEAEVAFIGYEAEVDPVAVGSALKSAFEARGYGVGMVTMPGNVYFNIAEVPELNASQVFVYLVPKGIVFVAQRQPAP